MNKSQSLAFTALLCAIHILIIFMIEFVPFFDLALIFFMPIFSAILAVKCQFRYSLILFVSTMIIGCIINPVSALLSLMTPLIYGITYGFLIKHNVKSTTIVYVLSTAVALLLILDINIITQILDEDFIHILCNFFHLDSFYYSKEAIFVLVGFIFSQSFVTHFTLKFVLKKMKIKVKSNQFPPAFLIYMVIIFITTAACLRNPIYRHLNFILATIFAIPHIIYGFQKNKAIVPILITSSVFFLTITIPLLNVVNQGYRYLLFLIIIIPPFLYGVYRQFKEHSLLDALTII